MKSGNIHILDLDFEYKYWKNKLMFFLTELDIFISRVQVLKLEKNNFNLSQESSKLIQMQTESIKQMLNQIDVLEEEMALYAEDYPISKSHEHYRTHSRFRHEMDKVFERQESLVSIIMPELAQE